MPAALPSRHRPSASTPCRPSDRSWSTQRGLLRPSVLISLPQCKLKHIKQHLSIYYGKKKKQEKKEKLNQTYRNLLFINRRTHRPSRKPLVPNIDQNNTYRKIEREEIDQTHKTASNSFFFSTRAFCFRTSASLPVHHWRS